LTAVSVSLSVGPHDSHGGSLHSPGIGFAGRYEGLG